MDLKGNVSEAPGENIFMIKNNKVITPSLSSSALEGLTRASIFELSKDLGYNVIIKKIRKSELYQADEIFLSGTAAEITPIIQLDHKKIGTGRLGKVTTKLMAAYSDVVMNKNEKYSHWITEVY
ncbi:MAG: putative branched-chain-amino-acid aminotransferase [Nitrosopumilales archaeon]|nr:MAG: putative branched-chain-amino-acid aminotransferase [Nitrosopumilales archaeon]